MGVSSNPIVLLEDDVRSARDAKRNLVSVLQAIEIWDEKRRKASLYSNEVGPTNLYNEVKWSLDCLEPFNDFSDSRKPFSPEMAGILRKAISSLSRRSHELQDIWKDMKRTIGEGRSGLELLKDRLDSDAATRLKDAVEELGKLKEIEELKKLAR